MRIFSFVVFGAGLLWYAASGASAHGIVSSQIKTVGQYSIEFEASADAGAVVAGSPATYVFRLFDADTKEPAAFDSVYINILKKDGSLVFEARLDPSAGFFSGPTMSANITEAGEYLVDVSFEKDDPVDLRKEIAKADFAFEVMSSQSQQAVPVGDKASSKDSILRYVVPLLLFIIGLAVGRVAIPQRKTR